MSTDTVELMNRGMHCLMEHMGALDAQRFISAVLREKYDYSQWQSEYFDGVTPEEFSAAALEWAKTHPGIKDSYAGADDKNAS
ncbi:MAG: hypothetical protein J5838_06900 [Desulfovibrio sp.]|nr:hypothetical protein [Desulfovibrio sp.]